MPMKNDNSNLPEDWTNRKLLRAVRDRIFGERIYGDREIEVILDEIKKRFVRSANKD